MTPEEHLTALEKQIGKLRQQADTIHTEPLPDVLRFTKNLQDLSAWVEDLKSQVSQKVDMLKKERIPELFKEAGVTSMAVDGYRYVISHTTRANIKEGQKEKAFEWLRENDLADIITETVNASTLSATARMITEEKGIELDPDLFNVYVQPGTSITKTK